MRANTVVCIFAVGALMMGVFGLYVSGEFMSGSVDDPYDSERSYVVSGQWDGAGATGTASCGQIRENGSFHNYMFQISVSDGEGTSREVSFTVIFGPDDLPDIFTYSGNRDIGGEVLPVYVWNSEGITYMIAVSEHCLVKWFEVTSGQYGLSGSLTEGE